MPATTDPTSPQELSAIANDLATLKRDFASLLADLRSGPLSSAKAAAQGAAEQLGEKAADLYGQAAAQAGRGADAIAHEIEERPLITLLVAFSVGFVASRLITR